MYKRQRLHTDEVLIALSICAVDDPFAARAIAQLPRLKGLEAHASVLLSPVDEDTFRRLGVNLTCQPKHCLLYTSRCVYATGPTPSCSTPTRR